MKRVPNTRPEREFPTRLENMVVLRKGRIPHLRDFQA